MAGNGNRLFHWIFGVDSTWGVVSFVSRWKGDNALHLYPDFAN